MFQEESQDIEYKESWKDEYLKWICGFANAHGGRIFIGINDEKEVVGIKNSKQLMEDIPNKIVTTLGIVSDVNLHHQGCLDYIEICDQAIYQSPTKAYTTTDQVPPSKNSKVPHSSTSFSRKWDVHGMTSSTSVPPLTI